MSQIPELASLLRRDRAWVVVALTVVILSCWLYLLNGAGMDVQGMRDMVMPMQMGDVPKTPSYWTLTFFMWVVMMAAMMLPSAAPVILLHATITGKRTRPQEAVVANALFVLGYLTVWTSFALAASTLQWALDSAALLSPTMAAANTTAAGVVLIAAGFYQWTPLKQACLRRCRSPLDFILSNWRERRRGALVMGIHHGLICVGCCWMLMLLLFVGGVMNVVWISGVALFVFVEKLAPVGVVLSRLSGMFLVAWGGMTLAFLR